VRAIETGLEAERGAETLRIEAVAEGIVRVRSAVGGAYEESPLNRYGFVLLGEQAGLAKVAQDGATWRLTLPGLQVSVDAATGRLSFADGAGLPLTATAEGAGWSGAHGFHLSLAISPDEHLLGLGDQQRKRLDLRGTTAELWIRNVKRYIPIPLLLSSAGWGVLVNTTRRHRWDLAAAREDRVCVDGEAGTLDFYVFAGDYAGLLDAYTELTGKPILPPKWSFGLWFCCRNNASDHEVLTDAYIWRKENLPVDLFSLEPGWMEVEYDDSVDKKWHPQRYHLAGTKWVKHNFITGLRNLGIKLSLWLCNDYDLSIEAERRRAAEAAARGEAPAEAEGGTQAEFEDQRLVQGEVRLDRYTKPDEPWFEHLKKFIDNGAVMFKQDGAWQTMEHPDRLFANGMTDARMHNLYPLLYAKQMSQGYREYTNGKRACIFTPNGWAGIQRWAGTWAGDTGGGAGSLACNLILGLCGISWTTADMEVGTAAGIHFGFVEPWAQVNSFASWRHPWLLPRDLYAMFRDYAELRMRLLPYLYSIAVESNRTGRPMLRALPLEFPEDPKGYAILHEYLLGPAFLSAAFEDRLYLPAGRWLDYWTGEIHEGPCEMAYTRPAGRGGALLLREGSIVPWGPPMLYVDEAPADPITWEVFCPRGGSAAFTLWEDDGLTYAYEEGQQMAVPATADDDGTTLRIRVGPPEGDYEGALRARRWRFRVRDRDAVEEVRLNGQRVLAGGPDAPGPSYNLDPAAHTLEIRLGDGAWEQVEITIR